MKKIRIILLLLSCLINYTVFSQAQQGLGEFIDILFFLKVFVIVFIVGGGLFFIAKKLNIRSKIFNWLFWVMVSMFFLIIWNQTKFHTNNSIIIESENDTCKDWNVTYQYLIDKGVYYYFNEKKYFLRELTKDEDSLFIMDNELTKIMIDSIKGHK